ncbi:odorant receptor 4-like [Andrena cerasifolii]|uniref:odorant receptor 4-like n=1 Tax=Andrena cerasifolii TaxID=2819439 RepID=UPI004037D36F
MVVCVQNAEPAELSVFQAYVDKFSTFYVLAGTWFYISMCVVVVGTLLLPQPFPTNAEYPFSVDYEPMRSIIFLHQTVAGTQCAAHTCVNVFGALLISFAAARIELLTSELRDVVDTSDLASCIKKYYRVKGYAQDVADAVQFIALITVTMCGLAVLLCGIVVVGRQPVTVKAQFLALAFTTLLEVFMCAWPADHLMHVSQSVAQGAYESTWYERSVKMQKLILCAMIPQEAVTISIKCVMPILSLRYFCTYVSNIFSFFTALRVMMTDED